MKQHLLKNRINEAVDSVPIENGGTAARTKKTACKNLGLVSQDQVKQPDGIIILGEDGFISRSDLPPDLINVDIPSLFGPEDVDLGASIDIFITNYSSDVNYVITAEGGSFTRETDKIKFTGGYTIMTGGVTVNGKFYEIYIGPPRPLTPSLIAPSGAILLAMGPGTRFISSDFIAGQPGDTHASSDWQVSTDPEFNTITMEKNFGVAGELLNWDVVTFARDTQYYARIRHRGASQGISKWSAPLAVKTRYAFVPKRLVDTMVPEDIRTGDAFGSTVAADVLGTRFVVGSPSDDTDTGNDTGSLYVFDRVGYTNTQKLKLTTVESGQVVDIYIPAGGSIIAQFDSPGAQPVTYTTSQSISVPEGATLLSMVGHGGPGSTSTTAQVGLPAYPDGLPPYNPGQPYIAPGTIIGYGWSIAVDNGTHTTTLTPTYGSQPSAPPYAPSYNGQLVDRGPWSISYYDSQYDITRYHNYTKMVYSGWLTTSPGQAYIAPTGNSSYPSGLPPYVPAGTYQFYGESATVKISGETYTFLGGLGDPTIVGQGNPSYPNGLPPYSPGQPYIATTYELRWQLTSAASNTEGAVNPLTMDPLYPVQDRPLPGSAPTAIGQTVDAGSWSQWDAVAGPLGSPVPGWRNYSTSIYQSYSFVTQGQDYIAPTGNPSYPTGLPPYIPAGTTTIPSMSLTAYINANQRFGYSVGMSDDGLYVAGGALTANPRSKLTELTIALGGSVNIATDSNALVSNDYTTSQSLNLPGDATTVTLSGKGAAGSGATDIPALDMVLSGSGSQAISQGVPSLSLTSKGADGTTLGARKWVAMASVAELAGTQGNTYIKAYYLADDGTYCVTRTPNTLWHYGQLPGNKVWVNIETAQSDVLNVVRPGSGKWVIATAADGSRVLINDLTVINLTPEDYHELPALPAGKTWSKIFRLVGNNVCIAIATDGSVVWKRSIDADPWQSLSKLTVAGKTWVAVTGLNYNDLYALAFDGTVYHYSQSSWSLSTLPGNDSALFTGTNVWRDLSMAYTYNDTNGSSFFYEALTESGVSSIHGALQTRTTPLIITGSDSTFTINGQTYTCPGGVGVAAAEQTFDITLPGTAVSLAYTIPVGGTGHITHPAIDLPFIVGEPTTVTVGGQTYTFPGGNGVPASITSYTISFEESTHAGSVVLSNFSNGVWNTPIKLLPDVNTAELKFGYALDFDYSGLRLAVGAPGHSSLKGAVYVYIRNNGEWTIETILKPSTLQPGDYFGSSLSLSSDGNTLVVGARNALSSTGSVYIFERNGTAWTQRAQLYYASPAMNQYFGQSVDITGDGKMLIVGIPGLSVNGDADTGAAVVYAKGDQGWTQTALLLAANHAAGDKAGTWVSIDETGVVAVVGAPYASYLGVANSGAIYTYANFGAMWAEDQTLGLYARATGDNLGSVVALTKDGAMLFAGSSAYDHSDIVDSGAISIYEQL